MGVLIPVPMQKAASRLTLYVRESNRSTLVAAENGGQSLSFLGLVMLPNVFVKLRYYLVAFALL